MTDAKPVNMLMILDGWGINPETAGNAYAQAETPFLDSLFQTYPHARLSCSGNAVGLPDGTMGNSEVGHMNIGAGRRVLQSLVRINTAISDESFFSNPEFSGLMDTVSASGKALHLTGLLSDGGVHSHLTHLFALVEMAGRKGVRKVYIHPIMDGRDTPPDSGLGYIRQLSEFLADKPFAKIATIVGRYWAMDRDTRWDRVQKAYDMLTLGTGGSAETPEAAVQQAYTDGQTDEFIKPVVVENVGLVKNGDGLIFFNFRADRAKEITRSFTEPGFSQFNRKQVPDLAGFVCMTQYDETFDLPAAFGPQHLSGIFGEVLSKNNIPQLRIAETEKYAHVTYFFNGGDETVFPGEERVLIPSPREVATYDEKPEMSAFEVADAACGNILSGKFEFVVLNFANMDMVGHTGILDAAIKGCEAVDQCAGKVIRAIWKTGGTAVVTADHGNSEEMIDKNGSPHTAHTLNQVPMIIAGEKYSGIRVRDGILGDIAPTLLKIIGITPPEEMTGASLI